MKQNTKEKLKKFWDYWDNRNGRICFNCYIPATERAHIIGQGKLLRAKYGNEVIDNCIDWLPSCHDCNSLIDVGKNLNADKVATIILSHMDDAEKREKVENIVRENIKRKRGKNGR